MAEHISRQFDVELAAVQEQVGTMAQLVEAQFSSAMTALVDGDLHLVNKVLDAEHQVNDLHIKIDEMVMNIIARRQPAAGDLRQVMTITKLIMDLERIGDKADKIARRARSIHGDSPVKVPCVADLNRQAGIALTMLRTAFAGFTHMDPVVAAQVARDDLQLDEQFRSIQRQLITYMMEDPRTIGMAIEVVEITKAIERVGDHAKNIAEYVVYLVKGVDVRHSPIAEIEKQVG